MKTQPIQLSRFLTILAILLFFGAMFWAKGRDPFHRIWFKLKVKGYGKADCVVVLPKTARLPLPVVLYVYGSGGSMIESGNELRQLAEMGLAAVGMEYNQTSEAAFDAQFGSLLNHVRRQEWADTNQIAWVGFSLGAQRTLSFAFRHAEERPKLMVRVAGGWVEEASNFKFQIPNVLLVHGENDEVFPLTEVRRVAESIRSNGAAVELKVLAGQGHGLQPNRLQVFRGIGEWCLTRLKGEGALRNYRSILSWQDGAVGLEWFWLPGMAWMVVWLWLRRDESRRNGDIRAVSLGKRQRWLRWVAGMLAIAAVGETALHVVPPRLRINEWLLSLARKHLVQNKELKDFDFVSTNSVWMGKRLKILLTHVELANYNRELINWRLDEAIYRDFVLSPQIDAAVDEEMGWRRELWENFYPRIRHEDSTEAAAEIVARFLRERVTVTREAGSTTIEKSWERQIADPKVFEALYVAALRSAGIPARLDSFHRAEIWTQSTWKLAPRPLVEEGFSPSGSPIAKIAI